MENHRAIRKSESGIISDISGQPYSVSVLKEGYCTAEPDGSFKADGTITLITGPQTILVDTGGPWDREFLIAKLKEKGLTPDSVAVVVGTHGHSDHVGNLGLFSEAKIIVGCDISVGDRYLPNQLAEGQPYPIDDFEKEGLHRLTDEVKYMGGVVGGGILVLIPAIHIHSTGRKGCCGNRCGMFLSILFAAIGVVGALYSIAVAAVGLVDGPVCMNQSGVWGRPFQNSTESYLSNSDTWDWCKEPENVVEFNIGLFSTLLVAGCLELLLCGFQMLNGLFGCICGTCNNKEVE